MDSVINLDWTYRKIYDQEFIFRTMCISSLIGRLIEKNGYHINDLRMKYNTKIYITECYDIEFDSPVKYINIYSNLDKI